MKQIKVISSVFGTQYIQVDDQDYEPLLDYRWGILKGRKTLYAQCTKNKKCYLLHRVVMKAPKGVQVDHIDGNGLNCQKSNLRLCTHSQNQWNKGAYGDRKVKGVYLVTAPRLKSVIYVAKIGVRGKQRQIGCYRSIAEAAMAYNNAAMIHYGEFAALNDLSQIAKLKGE